MKKALFTLAIALLTIAAQAQLKIHDDGWVSLGSLTKAYGTQVNPSGYAYFRTQSNDNYSWGVLSKANAHAQKHWIVENNYNNDATCLKKHMFYVLGNGSVYYTGLYSLGNTCMYSNNSKSHIDGIDALSTILNINGYYYEEDSMTSPEEIENSEYIDREAVDGMIGDLEKHKVALSAENMAEVFPDAVRTDPEARLCIDYNAVITMLVEAVKQQQEEIKLLQKTLEENGLTRK